MIRGSIQFEGPPPPGLRTAVVRVQLLDVSRVDAPSVAVAEWTSRGGGLEFVIDIPPPAPSDVDRYVLRAHVSSSGSPDVQPGDYITMESYPVSAGVLTVRRVNG